MRIDEVDMDIEDPKEIRPTEKTESETTSDSEDASDSGRNGFETEMEDTDSKESEREFQLYLASNQILLDEIKDQHSETLNSINSLMQRSGIIMAFNSVFIIELFRLQPSEGTVWWITIASILTSMLLGLTSIITGRLTPMGADINKVVNTYNNGTYEDLTPIIFNGKSEALEKTTSLAKKISNLILIQTLFLITSVIGLIIIEV